MDNFESLTRATAEFEHRLRAVGPDQWDLPTPCTGWDVRGLVNHVAAGNRMAVRLLDGCSREEAMATIASDVLGADPVDTAVAEAAAQAAAFGEPVALERVCHHPMADIPGAMLIGFRVGDLTLHAWDLARATGGEEALDADLVAEVWAAMEPMGPFIAETGDFGDGPSGDVDEDAPLQTRMLDLAGRRP